MRGTPSHQHPTPTGTPLQAGTGRHSTSGAQRAACKGTHTDTPTCTAPRACALTHTLPRRQQQCRSQSVAQLPHKCTAHMFRQIYTWPPTHNCSLLDAKDSHMCTYHLMPRHTKASPWHTHTPHSPYGHDQGRIGRTTESSCADIHGRCASGVVRAQPYSLVNIYTNAHI